MESDSFFTQDLLKKLSDFGNEMQATVLPTLKTDYRNFSNIFTSFLGILKKKGLLLEDPYQYDEKISDIKPVSNEPFLEGQKATIMSIRLHNFENQLNFLNEVFQFSLEDFSLQRLKNTTQFTRFIRWDSFSDTSTEINTRMVAELVSKIRRGDDSISNGLINDMINQLASYQSKITEGLKKISAFKREEYKAMIRTTFWDTMNLTPEEANGNIDEVTRKIKKEFGMHVKGYPYIPELIKELLDEDFSPSGENLKNELLTRLVVKKNAQTKQKEVVDFKQSLMEALRSLASLNLPLESAMRKLRENATVIEDDRVTLGERFQRWLRSLMGIKAQPHFYEVELYDPITLTTKNDEIDFEKFSEDTALKIRTFSNIANRNSPQFVSISQKTEDEILQIFDRNFIDMAKIIEKINGLDLFFKTETPKEKRPQIKGVKTETAQMKSILSQVNKLKHEYVAAVEEVEQLKRLGVLPKA